MCSIREVCDSVCERFVLNQCILTENDHDHAGETTGTGNAIVSDYCVCVCVRVLCAGMATKHSAPHFKRWVIGRHQAEPQACTAYG